MLKIRLQRIGRKNDPAFRVVLTDSKNSTKSGKFLEVLGTYNPKQKNLALKKDEDVFITPKEIRIHTSQSGDLNKVWFVEEGGGI
jgi:ribosomal protein S16